MRISAAASLAVLLACTALFAAGCGGGSGSSGSSTAPAGGTGAGQGGATGGAPKKATAPNAPAGSKVVSCTEGRVETVGLRATAVDCGTARATVARWERNHACTLGRSSSRSSCSLGGFRCQAVRSGRGAAVSCARPGADVSFVAKAWLLKGSGG
jgi:hypothetical protein